MPPKNPKIVIPKDQYTTQAEYKRLWCREKRRLAGRDKDRIPGYEEYVRQYNKMYRETKEGYKEKKAAGALAFRDALRTKIIGVYSGGTNQCARCGCANQVVLDLDHVDETGGEHRREHGGRGSAYKIYRELELAGFPPGYQILCRNCNWIKHLERRERRSHAQRQSCEQFDHYAPEQLGAAE